MRNTLKEVVNKSVRDSLIEHFFFTGKCMMFIALFIFLVVNIYFSQAIHPLYPQVVAGNRPAVVEFLRRMRGASEFTTLLLINKSVYGADIEAQVFSDERHEHALILEYQKILSRNPKSRDALYNLSVLYNRQKSLQKAQSDTLYYLEKAKEIDPTL